MSAILIIGPSGSGKSTSIRNLDPKKTMVFSTLGKGLPFKGSKKNYTVFNKESNPKGNLIITSSSKAICQWIKHVDNNMPEITSLVVDDNTFVTAKELDRRRDEKSFEKFNDIAHEFLVISEIANTVRPDLNVYFLHHTRIDGDGLLENKTQRALSFGKLIEDKLASVEAQFEIVLLACKITTEAGEIEYKFKTRDVDSTAKAPIGMFDEVYIDNDLALINERIKEYYEGE